MPDFGELEPNPAYFPGTMVHYFKLQPKFRIRITRPEDSFLKLVRNFVLDFHRFHDRESLTFEESVLQSLKMNADAQIFLRTDITEDGIDLKVDDSFIYPPGGLTGYEYNDGHSSPLCQLVTGEENTVKVAEIFSRISNELLTLDQIEALFKQSRMSDVSDRLLKAGAFIPDPGRRFDFDRKGIHRLQHASILFHSGQTRIITDPHFHSFYEPGNISGISFTDLAPVDAILITHYHGDHYDLSSLALFDRKTRIYFPKVRRATILSPDVENELRALGFNHLFPLENTYQPIKIGDFTLTPTPFRGEQATAEEKPYRHDVRNIGLTYVLECDGMRSWILGDSGKDWEGDMIEEALIVREKVGPLTHIISNLRGFHNQTPFYLDNGTTWLTLSTEQKKKHSQRTASLSLGVQGLAKILEIFPEANLLPYAHWWANHGESPAHDDKEILEFRNLISDKRKIREWKIGERLDYFK